MLRFLPAMILFLFVVFTDTFGQNSDDTCLVQELASADDSTTVGELRIWCQQKATETLAVDELDVPASKPNIILERIASERAADGHPFIITAHLPNYLTWSVMDSPNQAPFTNSAPTLDPLDDTELTFQVSIKAPIWRNVFESNVNAYVAYTARSWWQWDNDDVSAPFRETNYQPEVFLRIPGGYNLLGMNLIGWDFGFNHESNGRSNPLSRSWNRILARAAFQATDDLTIFTRAWYRLPEDEEQDDNPHMHRYYGYGDLRTIWTPNRNTFTAITPWYS